MKETETPKFVINCEILPRTGLLLPVCIRGGIDVIRNAFCVHAK